MALPAVVCHYCFRHAVRSSHEPLVFASGFTAGATAVLLGALLYATSLMAAGKQFEVVGYGVFVSYLPVAVVEGLVTGSVVVLLRKVRPELLEAPLLVPAGQEVSRG